MTWETPELVEIDMSAEIGGYQGDDFGPDAGERTEPTRTKTAPALRGGAHD
jgi:hypothetical protein